MIIIGVGGMKNPAKAGLSGNPVYDDELLSYLFYCRIIIHVIVNKQLVSGCF
jgi:hypothetical protein